MLASLAVALVFCLPPVAFASTTAPKPGDPRQSQPMAPPLGVAPKRSLTLEWVGDIALSAQRGLPAGGLDRALRPVRPLLRGADLTLGNLEGTLSRGGASKCVGISASCFAFQAPPGVAGELGALGFDLLNQANNHSLDYGPSGRAQTISALTRAGIAH